MKKTTNEMRVLLVDADPLACENLRLFFRLRGLTATRAANGEEALHRLAESPCDLVLSDVALPEMNGLALMRRIHVRHPELPVILLSASADPQLRQEAATWDAAGFLRRPLNRCELERAVEAALGHKAEPTSSAWLAESEAALAL